VLGVTPARDKYSRYLRSALTSLRILLLIVACPRKARLIPPQYTQYYAHMPLRIQRNAAIVRQSHLPQLDSGCYRILRISPLRSPELYQQGSRGPKRVITNDLKSPTSPEVLKGALPVGTHVALT
jgi:hypothetical protein